MYNRHITENIENICITDDLETYKRTTSYRGNSLTVQRTLHTTNKHHLRLTTHSTEQGATSDVHIYRTTQHMSHMTYIT